MNARMFFYICYMAFRKPFLFLFSSSIAIAQYTDQINSNRPGASIGAFSVVVKCFSIRIGICI